MTTIPVEIKYNNQPLQKIKAEFASLSAEQKKALQSHMRDLGQQRRLEAEINRELKQQIAERRRLVNLTEKLNKDLAGQKGKGGFGLPGGMGGSLLAGAATLGIGAAAVDFAKDSFTMAAASERLEKATDNLGRRYSLTSDEIVKAIKGASDNTIKGTDAMLAANKALLFGIVDNEKEFKELTEIAVGLGRAMGQDATKSLDDLTTGIGRQSRLILDNLGIIVNAEEAYRKYALSVGKSASELSDAEKQQAFTNETLEQGRKKLEELGEQELDTAGKVERLTAGWADFQVAFGSLADSSGTLDFLDSVVQKGIEGAEAWGFVFENAQKYEEALKRAAKEKGIAETTTFFGQVWEKPVNGAEAYLQLAKKVELSNEDIAASWQEINKEEEESNKKLDDAAKKRAVLEGIEAQRAKHAEDAAKATEEEAKRLEKLADIRKDFARSLIEIDKKAQGDTADTWDDYFEDEADNWKDHNDQVADIRKDFAKDIAKIDKDLAKDQAKLQKDLQKDLAKISKDEKNDIAKVKKDAAKEQKQDRKRAIIDAKADERLFQLDLRNLAAEGEANAIQQALERRKIEEEIAAEKQAAEEEIEQENLDDEIAQIKKAAEAEREEAKATAEERAQDLQAEAEEEKALRQEALAEALAEEQQSYQERLAELRSHRDEKLAEIEQGKADAIAKLGEELTEIEEMTKAELKALIPIAGQYGEDWGAAFAEGIDKGFDIQDVIDELLGSLGDSSSSSSTSSSSDNQANNNSSNQSMQRFAKGGQFVVDGQSGTDTNLVQFMATKGETVTITPPNQGGATIQINVSGPGLDTLAGIMKRYVEAGLDEYDDLLASVLN